MKIIGRNARILVSNCFVTQQNTLMVCGLLPQQFQNICQHQTTTARKEWLAPSFGSLYIKRWSTHHQRTYSVSHLGVWQSSHPTLSWALTGTRAGSCRWCERHVRHIVFIVFGFGQEVIIFWGQDCVASWAVWCLRMRLPTIERPLDDEAPM